MQSRKTISILLALVSFSCFIAFSAVSVYFLAPITTDMQKILDMLIRMGVLGPILLSVLCLVLGALLLVHGGRKANPQPILLFSAGVLFLSVYCLCLFLCLQFLHGFYPIYKQIGTFLNLAWIASAVSIIAGIGTYMFAAALARHIRLGTLQPLPVKAVPAYVPPKRDPSPGDALKNLKDLKEAGLLTEEEYEQKRKECLDKL